MMWFQENLNSSLMYNLPFRGKGEGRGGGGGGSGYVMKGKVAVGWPFAGNF